MPPLPQVAHQFPEPMSVVLKVRLSTTPVATLHTSNATLWLQPFVEVLAVASNSAFQSLFSFNVVSEVGWEGPLSRRLHFRPHSSHLLCSIHTGLLAVPSMCQDVPASGPLHMLYPVLRILFSWLLAWLASSRLKP